MKNIEKIKKWLSGRHPLEKSRIVSSDCYRIMNCWLQNEQNRLEAVEGMKLSSKCDMCARKEGCSFDGNAFFCRQGILEWMEMETNEKE